MLQHQPVLSTPVVLKQEHRKDLFLDQDLGDTWQEAEIRMLVP